MWAPETPLNDALGDAVSFSETRNHRVPEQATEEDVRPQTCFSRLKIAALSKSMYQQTMSSRINQSWFYHHYGHVQWSPSDVVKPPASNDG